MATHRLDDGQVHYEWNNALPSRLEIEPGDTVVFDTRDAADGHYKQASTHADVLARGPFRGHPLTGPVRVRGARPGDVLTVEIQDVRPRAPFGWTAIRPGRGLLPESDFDKPFLQIWDVSDGRFARMGRHGVAVPLAPFPGVMGTALPEPGGHSTMPPRKNGGNMDIAAHRGHDAVPAGLGGRRAVQHRRRHGAGATARCVTAVEMQAQVTLRRAPAGARPRRAAAPHRRAPGAAVNRRPYYATTANGPDLFASAQQASARDAHPSRSAASRAGGRHPHQRRRGPEDQRDRGRLELDRVRVPSRACTRNPHRRRPAMRSAPARSASLGLTLTLRPAMS